MSDRVRALSGSLLLYFIAGALILLSQSLTIGTPARMGPRFFPLMIAGLIAVCASVLLVQAIASHRTAEFRETVSFWTVCLNLGVLSGAILLFGHGIRPLGLIPVTLVISFVIGLLLGRMRPLEAFIYSLGLTVGIVLVFRMALGLNLPVWPL